MVDNLPAFTPVLDCIQRHNENIRLRDVAVFGVLWRYNVNGVTEKSHRFMANCIGVGRRTVLRSICKLCQSELIEDLTPNLKKPHKYQITRRSYDIIQNYLYQTVTSELRIRKRLPVISLAEAVHTAIILADVEADKLKPLEGFSVEQLEFISIAEKLREFVASCNA